MLSNVEDTNSEIFLSTACTKFCTNAVVAILVEISDDGGVGDFGVPVKLGEFLFALPDNAVCMPFINPCTKAVVAICVEFVLLDAVGAVGLKLGEFLSALADSKVLISASIFIKFSLSTSTSILSDGAGNLKL